MLDIDQFRDGIIDPALDMIDLYSVAASELVLGTALQESGLRYIKQINGPALGLWQMEPASHSDLWTNFLHYRKDLATKVARLIPQNTDIGSAYHMVGNLFYAAAMCRVHYYRVRAKLPKAGDIEAQAAYYKRWYNTPKGKGTEAQYIDNWRRYMG